MRSILLIAWREVKDHLRQPLIIVGTVAFYLIIEGLFVALFGVLGSFIDQPQIMQMVGASEPADVARELVVGYNVYVLGEPPVLGGLLGAHALLNDRERGTLPFLLLSPVSRVQLLLGKVFGCAALALGIHLVLGGIQSLALSRFELAQMVPELLPFSAGWCLAFFVGAPAWTLVLTAASVLISGLARDVRTSQMMQGLLGVVVGIASSAGLAYSMDSALLEAAVGLGGVALFLALVVVGQFVIQRDLSR